MPSASERGAPDARDASLGCGVPTAVADLHEGETVLDLGSGAGADVLISARRVGPTGQGDRARHDRRDARPRPRQRRRGRRHERRVRQGLPRGRSRSPDASVDVVISNCVINLSGDKPKVLAEAARVLRARRTVRRLRRDRRPRHGRRRPRPTWRLDRLHRRRAHRGRVPRRARRRRAPATSRSARPTASTSTPPRRSSAPASQA